MISLHFFSECTIYTEKIRTFWIESLYSQFEDVLFEHIQALIINWANLKFQYASSHSEFAITHRSLRKCWLWSNCLWTFSVPCSISLLVTTYGQIRQMKQKNPRVHRIFFIFPQINGHIFIVQWNHSTFHLICWKSTPENWKKIYFFIFSYF